MEVFVKTKYRNLSSYLFHFLDFLCPPSLNSLNLVLNFNKKELYNANMVYIIIILNSLILRVKNYPQKGDTNSSNEDCL